ncbi:MAG: putative sulfate exporter family transporter [Gammaproteobacteria bacterium]|nr:MAG: putative sulfate exporter family transporter [Gammaproteobacteria bacterium]
MLVHNPLNNHLNLTRFIFISIVISAFLGVINSPTALALGLLFSIFFTNPFPTLTQKGIKQGLKIAVIGLGFGISATEAIQANSHGIGLIIFSIFSTVILGIIVTSKLGLEKKLGFLITSGTAICGGSAIAAVAPVTKADNKSITVSLAIVFTLNAIALLIFPPIGHFFELSQQQFGLWAAIAIHDTSSVVGAALAYGDEALKTATTLKLSRTLWIIPLALFATYWFKSKGQKIAIPYFIGGFLLAILINSTNLLPETITENIVTVSKHLLVVILFFIGSTLSPKTLKSIGFKPLVLAVILWLAISSLSLFYIIS